MPPKNVPVPGNNIVPATMPRQLQEYPTTLETNSSHKARRSLPRRFVSTGERFPDCHPSQVQSMMIANSLVTKCEAYRRRLANRDVWTCTQASLYVKLAGVPGTRRGTSHSNVKAYHIAAGSDAAKFLGFTLRRFDWILDQPASNFLAHPRDANRLRYTVQLSVSCCGCPTLVSATGNVRSSTPRPAFAVISELECGQDPGMPLSSLSLCLLRLTDFRLRPVSQSLWLWPARPTSSGAFPAGQAAGGGKAASGRGTRGDASSLYPPESMPKRSQVVTYASLHGSSPGDPQ